MICQTIYHLIAIFIENPFPSKGLDEKQLMKKIDLYKTMCDEKWKNGACSGTVYGANEKLENLNVNVYRKFVWTNVLHADVFPDVRKMVIT